MNLQGGTSYLVESAQITQVEQQQQQVTGSGVKFFVIEPICN